MPSIMRMLRSFGRLRLLITLLALLVMVYVVGQLRSTDELDGLGAKTVAANMRNSQDYHNTQNSQGQPALEKPAPADDGLSLRKFKSNYNADQEEDGNELVYYKKDVPLIWVGGIPRSGTTLMRVMLDAHKDVRCGEETRIIPRVLSMHVGMTKSQKEMERLMEAKITEGVLDNALAAYILSIISEHGEKAPRLCNKDPFTLKSMEKILTMFPNSKFLFMVRDGRATVHSIISRHVTIKGFDIQSYRGGLQDWNRAIESMNNECEKVGPEFCYPVRYEQLVLHPRTEMEKILKFLDLTWDEMVIHHEKTINKTGGASLSGKELSTDQVERPINTEALTGWVSYIPPDVRKDMHKLAPMLHTLGYDPFAYPPNYGEPDQMVKDTDTNLKLDNAFYQDRKPKVEPEDGKHRAPQRFVVNGIDPHGKAYGVDRNKHQYNKLPRH